MSCGNCASHVENALNSLEGVWAQVDLEKGEALVRMKQEYGNNELKQAVKDAGSVSYTHLDVYKRQQYRAVSKHHSGQYLIAL